MALWGDTRRLVHIAAVVARHSTAHALTHRAPRLARWLGVARIEGPERLRSAFEELGGTFLKFGQMLALQPDILSLEYCNALFDLMDRVPAFGFEDVERILREDLGGGADELFDSFERLPIATASVGQVYRATLGGRRVAVKIQRPSVEEEFRGDIRLLQSGIQWIQRLRIKPLEWMVDPMSEFVGWTREELDYRHETRYTTRLGSNASGNVHERVPQVVLGRSSRRVLTAEFLEGVTVLDYLRAVAAGDRVTLHRVRSGGFEPDRFARHIVENFLGDAFRFGMFHADLHPANLMILPDNVVGYIDFGITAVLSGYSRRHLVELTLAYTRGDMEGMCAAFLKVSSLGPGSRPEAFAAGLHRQSEDWYQIVGGKRRLRKNFTLVMLDMLNLSRVTGVLPERDVVKYIRSAIAIDGLITRFAPDFNVGRYLETVCDRFLRLQGLQEVISRDQILAWTVSGASLARDGVLRSGRMVERVLGGDLPVRAEVTGGGPGGGLHLRTRALQQAAVVLGLAVMASWAGPRPELGLNLFSAAMLLSVAGLTTLFGTLRRLI